MKTNIKICARCGGYHRDLELIPLLNAPDDVSHYALCPATGQPILVRVSQSVSSVKSVVKK